MQIVALEVDGAVVAVEPRRFDLEVDLQDLLRDYPRLLLAPVPSYQDRSIWTIGYEVGTEAGSIDLLCLDSTGEVWVVETKLARNPEAKKQVVGQVLGYASSVAEWSVDRLAAVAQSYLGQPLVDHLADGLGLDEADVLIGRAVEKLRQGDITTVVVLDELNPVLQRLVEFVNAHASFDLLALTVTLMEHGGTRFVVPSVTGASALKAVSPTGRSEETVDELMAAATGEFLEVHGRLQAWAEDRGHRWVRSPKGWQVRTANDRTVIQLYPRWGSIELGLGQMIQAGMADTVEELRVRLEGVIGKRPDKSPNVLADKALARWEEFQAIHDDYVAARLEAG